VTSSTASQTAIGLPGRKRSRFIRLIRTISANRAASASFIVLIILGIVALIAPLIAPYAPNEAVLSDILNKPSEAHLLGTDELGRDILSRLIYGARISLTISLIVVAISLTIGIALGLIAGYYGSWRDTAVMRFMDIIMAFPGILLAIILMSVFGKGISNAILAICVISIPGYVRIVRGSVLSVKESEFVQAAIAMGARDTYIMVRHILPNILAPVIVTATMSVSAVILETAALGFLGLGVQPPDSEWGAMLANGKNYIFSASHVILFPGLAISITVLAFNMFGDGLRDALDPRQRN
jgi:ABC-type dipeptide/oligopeptide/nickel transport system permease subunit